MMDQINKLMNEAHKFWRDGKENDMLIPLKKALDLAYELDDKKKLVEILNEYAGGLRVVGRYGDAIEASKESIKIIENNFSTTSESYALSLMNLGNIYRMAKDYYNSEKYFLKSENILNQLNIHNYSYAGLCNNLSLLYQSTNDFKKAYEYQLKAINLNKEDDKYLIPLGISYNNMYEICKNLYNYKDAEKYLFLAEETISKSVGKKHPLYCAVLNNLADFQYSKGEVDKAKDLYLTILPLIKDFYGVDSESYLAVKENIEKIEKEIKTDNNSNKDYHINGLEISRKFFKDEILPILENKHPDILKSSALGLVGTGSECFQYDDKLSEDHDFGKRICIWIEDDVYKHSIDILKETFSKVDGKVEIYSISQFYKYYTLFKEGPKTIEEYRKVPQDLLAVATNGCVFVDNLGKFTEIRERLLKYYPKDLIFKKMAYCLNKIAQSGQYNYPRCLARNNIIGCQLAVSEFILNTSEFVHLINKRYMPFYKWVSKSTSSLEILGEEISILLDELVKKDIYSKEETINKICNIILKYIQDKRWTNSNIDFLTYQAKEIVKNIEDEELKNEDTWIK